MKNAFLPLSAVLLAGVAAAQHLTPAQVPAAAKATFQAKFPAAQAVKWEKEGADVEVGFRLSGKTMSAVLTPAGELRETETALPLAQLPAAVRAALARNYKAVKVVETAAIVRADGSTMYEAEISQRGKRQDVLFTADGRVTH